MAYASNKSFSLGRDTHAAPKTPQHPALTFRDGAPGVQRAGGAADDDVQPGVRLVDRRDVREVGVHQLLQQPPGARVVQVHWVQRRALELLRDVPAKGFRFSVARD